MIRESLVVFGSVGSNSARMVRCLGHVTVMRSSSRAAHQISEAPDGPNESSVMRLSATNGVSADIRNHTLSPPRDVQRTQSFTTLADQLG